MKECVGYIFSNEPIYLDKPDRFSFYTIRNDLERIELKQASNNSNPYLIKFNYSKENTKYLVINDQKEEVFHFCSFELFNSHFVCYITKNKKIKIYPKNKKRFNWLNVDVSDTDSIENIFDFALLPHKFNNFFQVSQGLDKKHDFIEEFQNIIFQFRPNGRFLNPDKYFDFTLNFLLFYNEYENEKKLSSNSLFNYFISIVINELFEMKQYFELSVISFCDKNRKTVPPLEVSHIQKIDIEKAKKLCDTVIIFYDNLFLLWAFNANIDFDFYVSLYNKWKPKNELKFDVEKIFEFVIQKVQSNDFSNYSLQKFLEFVCLYLQEDQIDYVKSYILENQSKFSKSVLKHIQTIILHSNEEKQSNRLLTARVDQKDYEYQNDNDNSNNDDKAYVDRINEFRGLWFNSIPNKFLYQRQENDTNVYFPPYTFRTFEPPKPTGSSRKFSRSTRPTLHEMNVFTNERKINSSKPVKPT